MPEVISSILDTPLLTADDSNDVELLLEIDSNEILLEFTFSSTESIVVCCSTLGDDSPAKDASKRSAMSKSSLSSKKSNNEFRTKLNGSGYDCERSGREKSDDQQKEAQIGRNDGHALFAAKDEREEKEEEKFKTEKLRNHKSGEK